ncbi:hypothetical protein DRO26_03865 [Candidatus Bathyarchaeota archaeon]|nr:MAG: hypothetical protein DRO26_03865 [Candidatus Bathyarchaeota archaeon]
MVAAVVSIHGDDHGLVLPPKIAPIQVIIIPIPYKGYEEKVAEKAKEVENKLKVAEIRVKLDLREKLTPGSKFYEWELKGVPLRIEVGPKDIEQKTLTMVRRDTLERIKIDESKIVDETRKILNEIQKSLRKKAWEWFLSRVKKTDNFQEIIKLSNEKPLVIETYWCGKNECGLALEDQTNMNVLGISLESGEELKNKKCSVCGEEAQFTIRLAKTY